MDGASESTDITVQTAVPNGWIVQKFGGTCLGKCAASVSDIIKSGLKTNRIAVVCSARSSRTKNEGTTTRLLRAAKIAGSVHGPKGPEEFAKVVQDIQDDHIQAANSSIGSSQLCRSYEEAVNIECQLLTRYLESVHQIREVSPRAENMIVSIGEKLACQYLAVLLEDRGVPAHYVDLADVVERFGIQTHTPEHELYHALAEAFRKDVLACGDKVPIITGYFGHLSAGLLQSVGRGYSDLAAALVAIGISANELQIWKEVDGIHTADPRKVPTARLLPFVSPSEAAELTFYGSEVIHPFTMEQVINAEIPIRIKNVKNPRGSGTVILPDSASNGRPTTPRRSGLKLIRGRSTAEDTFDIPKRPTAVTIKRSVLVINLCSNKKTRAHGFLAKIFQILDKHHLSVDLIASSEVHVSLALHSEHPMVSGLYSSSNDENLTIDDERLKRACHDLEELGSVDVVTEMAILSLIGQRLKKMAGISGKFFNALGDNGINIEMISQGELLHF
ncbi:MAG: hypothetical protein Q9227_005833 [Pyrenula ochraceoflavens]